MEEQQIIQIMHDSKTGLSITEIVKITNISRSAVRTHLARLEGAGKVKARRIGMAKVYILNQETTGISQAIENNTANNITNNTANNHSHELIVKQLYYQFPKKSHRGQQ